MIACTEFVLRIWHQAAILLLYTFNVKCVHVQGQPSFVRVYKYPNFGGPNAAITNRTFFKADKVEMMWNKTNSATLLLTTTETSESSYYGDQGLHFVGMNGESSLVHLGRIHHMQHQHAVTGVSDKAQPKLALRYK